MKILGISAFYHDSAAAVLHNGEIVAAAQEERFSRIKQDSSFPTEAVKFCLAYSGFSLSELDAVVFYDKPLLKFERLLETYYGFAPRGFRSFAAAMPVWIKEKLFLKRTLHECLSAIDTYDKKRLKLLFPEHHLSHAASAFYASPFQEAAILTIDGVGEWATASIAHGKGNAITLLKSLNFPHSLGLLYSAFTYYLGFRVNSGEYKLMGLAPYGNPHGAVVQQFVALIKEHLVEIREDGSIWLNQHYFDYATGLRMAKDDRWARLFGFERRTPESELTQQHCDLALAIQLVTEEVVLKMAAEAKRLTGAKYLTLAGGVALNCVANGKLLKTGMFENIFVQPAAGDAGGALGAALAAHYIYFGQERRATDGDAMQGAYLGAEASDLEVQFMAKKYKAIYEKQDDFEAVATETAAQLNAGKVVGWFQGRMEFGPRALGNRSILGNPADEEMQLTLNLKIKYRESFRPFAPSVLETDAATYFELDVPSPYMLLVAPVRSAFCKKVPDNYYDLPLKERLYVARSTLQGITHIDFSARVQSVAAATNPRYHTLLTKMKALNGVGMLINTSFNVRGEPIVCTPEDAYRCFMRTEMDVLVINNFIFRKTEQPKWAEKDSWQTDFPLD